MCLGGDVGRYNCIACGQIMPSGPNGSLRIGPAQGLRLGNLPLSVPPTSVSPGDTVNFQCWYRDLGASNNFTDAVAVAFF